MEILSYSSQDSVQVTTLFREIFKEKGWTERPSDYMDEPHLLFHLPNNGLLLVAKDNNKVIATGGLIFLSESEGLLKRFYLSKLYRGTGVAQKLLTELEKKANKIGLNKIILDVSKNNARAIRFYEKSGFIKTQVDPRKDWIESSEPETYFYFYKEVV